jgi:hypothetical protein
MQSFKRYRWGVITTATLVAVVLGGTLVAPAMGLGVSPHVATAARSGSQPLSASADVTSTVTATATGVVTATATSTPTAIVTPTATVTPTVAATPTATMTPTAIKTPTPLPAASSTPALPTPTAGLSGGQVFGAGVYHFVGSLVASAGEQVSHVEGILTVQVGTNGAFSGSTLRLTSGVTVTVTGFTSQGRLFFDANGVHLRGQATAISINRISGLFTGSAGSTLGFWVATKIAPSQSGTNYTFAGHIASGPDRGLTYAGTVELWGDTYGGLLGWLRLADGTVLNVNGQSVNGNVNMLIIVRAGTPMFVTGTTIIGGNLRGTIAGPLAGDQGAWTATK